MDVVETDNEDIGANTEDEEIPFLQEEQHDDGVLRERNPETTTPVASAPAPVYTPYQHGDKNSAKQEEAGRPAHADADVLALPCGHVSDTGCLAPWFRTQTTYTTYRFDITPQPLTLRVLPPTHCARGGDGRGNNGRGECGGKYV